jgi:hypothetical protein
MDILNDFVVCPVCSQLYEEPRSLKCRHTLCLQCLERLSQDEQVICPICNITGNVNDAVQDFRTQSMIDAYKQNRNKANEDKNPAVPTPDADGCVGAEVSVKCVACETSDVTYLCSNCDYLLCGKCKEKHVTCDVAQINEIESTAESEKQMLILIRDEMIEKSEWLDTREDNLKKSLEKYDVSHRDPTKRRYFTSY